MTAIRPSNQTILRSFIGLFFVAVGVAHFVDPAPFLMIVPPFLPWPLALVLISGFFEIAGGLGLFLKATRRFAAWGLVALLIAVFPANIYMAVSEVYIEGMSRQPWLLWARLPLQFLLAYGLLWSAGILPLSRKTANQAKADRSNR
ncbi:MAG: hypothetical protein OSB21_08175 [Myxococcota bacterium]|nr:hypothetical protein [Myxococcota bacterium]